MKIIGLMIAIIALMLSVPLWAQQHHHEGDVHISVVDGYAVVLPGEYTGPHGEPDIYQYILGWYMTDEPGFELEEDELTSVDIVQTAFTPGFMAYSNDLVFGEGASGVWTCTGHSHLDFYFPTTGDYSFSFKLANAFNGNTAIPTTNEVYTIAWKVVPEPSSIALLGTGFGGALALLRRRRQS